MLKFFYRKTSPLTLAEIYYLFRHFSFFSLNIFLTQAAVGKHLKGKFILSHYNLLTIMSGVAPLSDSIPPSAGTWTKAASNTIYSRLNIKTNARNGQAAKNKDHMEPLVGRVNIYLSIKHHRVISTSCLNFYSRKFTVLRTIASISELVSFLNSIL